MERIILPLPPTINSYYNCNGHVKYLNAKAKAYRETVKKIVSENGWDFHADVRLHVSILISFKDKRVNDLDNRLKGLLDACTHANVWVDDALIDSMEVVRGNVDGKGTVRMTIQAFEDL